MVLADEKKSSQAFVSSGPTSEPPRYSSREPSSWTKLVWVNAGALSLARSATLITHRRGFCLTSSIDAGRRGVSSRTILAWLLLVALLKKIKAH